MKRHQQVWEHLQLAAGSEPVQALQQLVNEYPYFSPAQLLLAAHMQEQQHLAADAQAQKAALHVPNTFWLQYQLAVPVTANAVIDEPASVSAPDTFVASPVDSTVAEETLPGTTTTTDAPMQMNDTAAIATPTETDTNIHTALEDIQIPDSISLHLDGNVKDEPEELSPEEDLEAVSPEADAAAASKLSSILDEQLADFAKPVTAETALPISTEPYHTIDYFASQGIKADHLTTPQDNLSRKLRKFTDWLKQMKHEKPDTDDLGTDPELESAIQDIAGNSNEAREIVTVTMAEVLEKQGKYDKAIQLYIKLSFLNPDKSAYFASKIQQLKGI